MGWKPGAFVFMFLASPTAFGSNVVMVFFLLFLELSPGRSLSKMLMLLKLLIGESLVRLGVAALLAFMLESVVELTLDILLLVFWVFSVWVRFV